MALIKTYNATPSVYTHQSRDFQLIGHIYEAVFNSSKLAIDMSDKMMPNSNFDERMLNLSATTVGFVRKHEYDANDLTMVLNSFAHLLKIKGTKAAIEYALNILLRSQGISDPYQIKVDEQSKELTLLLSKRLDDVVLLQDLFEYILPFGFNYRIILSTLTSAEGYKTEIGVSDSTVGIKEIENVGIVNDTFRTTIQETKNGLNNVTPRPIENGTIGEISTVFAINEVSPTSVVGINATWDVASYWELDPLLGLPYSLSVTLRINAGASNELILTENTTITFTDEQNMYNWETTLTNDNEEVTLTCSGDGETITAVSAGYPLTGSTLTVKIEGLVY